MTLGSSAFIRGVIGSFDMYWWLRKLSVLSNQDIFDEKSRILALFCCFICQISLLGWAI